MAINTAGQTITGNSVPSDSPQTKVGRIVFDATAITAAAPVGKGFAKISLGQGSVGSTDYSLFGLGYELPLSKRTSLYATYGVKGKDNTPDDKTMHIGVRHKF